MLLLIRHAHALQGEDDAARPLSRRGAKQIRALARFLHRSGAVAAKELWHSPLVRSRDTAALLAERLGLAAKCLEVAGLAPADDPALLAARLARTRRSVAIVGHEPHLGALASLLVTGRAEPSIFVFKKCAALALERAPGSPHRWRVRWFVGPGLLR